MTIKAYMQKSKIFVVFLIAVMFSNISYSETIKRLIEGNDHPVTFSLSMVASKPFIESFLTNTNDSDRPQPTIAVIGLSNEVQNEAWSDDRVGLGLRIILSQLFFDAGCFIMLEEKSEMRQRLNEFAAGIWIEDQSGYNFKQDLIKVDELGSDFAAYGKVYYFGKPKSKTSFGPMHIDRNSVIIRIEVVLEDLKTGYKIKEKGKGVSTTTAGSTIFQFREDNIELDKTNVGNATKEALSNAVNKVIAKYKKKYKLN